MSHYRLTDEARQDLESIWLYIAEDNPNAADGFLDTLCLSPLTLTMNRILFGVPRRERSAVDIDAWRSIPDLTTTQASVGMIKKWS